MNNSTTINQASEEELIAEQIKTLKQNALFNLDFDEYKRQVRNELNMLQNKLDYGVNSNTIVNNTYARSPYLIIGIILIVVAFILIILS